MTDEKPTIEVNQHATGAAGTIKLPVPGQNGDTRLLIVAQPTADEETTIYLEFRRQALENTRTPLQAIADDALKLPAQLRELVIKAAVEVQAGSRSDEQFKGEPTDDAIVNRNFTPEGCAFRIWMLASKAHPELKLEEVQKLLPDKAAVTFALARLAEALGLDREKKGPEPSHSGTGT